MARGTDSNGNFIGPAFANGAVWHEQRKFVVQELSNLGMGKANGLLTEMISQEADIFCVNILGPQAKKGPVTVNHLLFPMMANVVMRLVCGKPHRQDDPEVVQLTDHVKRFVDLLERGTLLETLQLNSKWATKLSGWLGIKTMINAVLPLIRMIKREVDSGKANEDGNLVDRYLAKIEKAKPGSSFYGSDGKAHTIGGIFDIYFGGKQ